jgi:hypothetical protein
MKQVTWMLLSVVAGGMIGYGFVGPLPRPDICQRVVLDEYLRIYLHPDRNDQARWIGATQLLSRLTIRAHLGDRALAEYNRRKITGDR